MDDMQELYVRTIFVSVIHVTPALSKTSTTYTQPK